MSKSFYRYNEIRYSESTLMLVKSEYPITKETKHGVWIDNYGQKKFIKTDAHKQYASSTIEGALESYYARKRRQIRILKHQLLQAEAALKLNPDQALVHYGWDL